MENRDSTARRRVKKIANSCSGRIDQQRPPFKSRIGPRITPRDENDDDVVRHSGLFCSPLSDDPSELFRFSWRGGFSLETGQTKWRSGIGIGGWLLIGFLFQYGRRRGAEVGVEFGNGFRGMGI